MESTAQTVFRAASARTVEMIADHNRQQRGNFLMASNYVNPAAAKLGYLLDDLVHLGPAGPRVSYLLSSGLEALSAAIKLARHTAVRANRDLGGWVLMLDERRRYHEFMDPAEAGSGAALIPHVVSASSAHEATTRFGATPWAAIIVVREETTDLQDAGLLALLRECRQAGGVVALSCAELDLSVPDLFGNGIDADVMIFGEGLADRQVPFGALTMSPAAHAVWRNNVDCFAHTSTFGGNALCAALVVDALERAGYVTDRHRSVLSTIESDPAVTNEFWGKHINPNIAAMTAVFNLNVDVRRAAGGRFSTGEGWDVIDCAGGFGSNLRGHNPPDLVPDVLSRHEPDRDYFADLEQKLIELTGFAHAFPSVSGAVANHQAVMLAALADPRRRTVVAFTGNYGGKTLFSLNLSKHGPQKTESDEDAFRPYYADLVYLDPFAPDAVEQLRTQLRRGDVALVWFELVQGAACRPLPDELVAAIDQHRDECGYLVGVDEVLTGGWRTGSHYLLHQDRMRRADIVTLGKTISDMTLPAAAVLVSDEVYAAAAAAAPDRVARLRTMFRSNLVAHIAVHALERTDDSTVRARWQAAYAELRDTLDAASRRSKVLGGVAGSAAHLKLTMDGRFLRSSHGSTRGTLLTLALSDLIYQRCRVYMPLLAIRHRVAADPAELAELADRLVAGTAGITPLMVYRHAVACIVGSKMPFLSRWLKGRAVAYQVQSAVPAVAALPGP